ncbi:uncharacterized protein LOC119712261 [Motacilla alba alba]|uniref:uncharacterized protein LOC119712261 n=1 Tax=Motacilla alba alba TaxID=1094192 RepID=UPI0018D4EDAD|nr:uncharacterized protein LOC119712261 [Motacilla alba alba]
MRRARAAGLPALAALLLVAAVRAQVQQEPFLETTEGTSISIKCSHANIRTGDFIHFYRQLPGQSPELVAVTAKAAKKVRAPEGRLTVSKDRRSSALWLAAPRRGDAAVYYCALGATGRGAGAAAGHEPPRAGPGGASRGRCRSARRAPGARLRSSFLCPEPARTGPARPRTAPARRTTRLRPALARSPRTARPPLAPEPAAASRQTAAGCASAAASRPPDTAAAALGLLCKATSCSLTAPGLGAGKAAALTGTRGLNNAVLWRQGVMD